MTDFPETALPGCRGGSFQGYKSIIDGTSDIGLVSSEMPDALRKWANKQKIEYTHTTIAFDALAVIINPLNPISNLSMSDLKEIFTGRISNWSTLGWSKGGDIKVFSQDPGRGGFVTWKHFVMGDKEHVTLGAKVLNGSSIVAKAISDNVNSIGYVGTITANKAKSKMISVNNVYPSLEMISSCKYPICRELQILSRSQPDPRIQKFINYCLSSTEGQAIIKRMGVASVV